MGKKGEENDKGMSNKEEKGNNMEAPSKDVEHMDTTPKQKAAAKEKGQSGATSSNEDGGAASIAKSTTTGKSKS